MRTLLALIAPAVLLAQVNVPYERIRAADQEPGNWLTYSRNYSGQRYSPLDTMEAYDPATNLWGVVKDRMPTPRSGGGAATYNGKIYVGGGELQNRQLAAAFRALEAYEPASNTWDVLPSMPSARHGNAMGFIGNKLHVVSGKMEGGGANDMAGTDHPYATASHDVLEIPSGTQ